MHGGGRRSTPTSLKSLRGNPGHRPINDREPKLPADAIPEPTEELDEDAAKEWRRVVGILHESGIARTVDQAGLTAYTQLWARWLKIERAIRKDGLIVIRPGKLPKLHPLAREASDLLPQLRHYLAEFGMTPASRSRIKVDQPAPRSKVDEFREKHGG